MELRLEVDQEADTVVGVTAVLGESAVQLQAFAAPRSEGIWEEIRGEIAASITRQGGTAEDTVGPLGVELQTRMPGQDGTGRTVFSPARFLGVDGPRWFLRAVLSGRAAIDPDAAEPLIDVVRATVVVRGDEPMAPRDLLPLTLPDAGEPAPAPEDGAGPHRRPGPVRAGPRDHRDPLDPPWERSCHISTSRRASPGCASASPSGSPARRQRWRPSSCSRTPTASAAPPSPSSPTAPRRASAGAVRSVTLRPRVNVPALVVELYDGSQTLNLVWLGRRQIGGIEPGTYLTARGRVTYKNGVPTIFNPAYDIKPHRGH